MTVKTLIPMTLFFLHPSMAEGFDDQGFSKPNIRSELTSSPYIGNCLYPADSTNFYYDPDAYQNIRVINTSPTTDPCKNSGYDTRDLNYYDFTTSLYSQDYWVLTANYEAAYREDIPGVPGQSFPVVPPQPSRNPFEFLPQKMASNSYRTHLIVDSSQYHGIPFLGIGTFSKTSNKTRLGRIDIDGNGYYDTLKFNAKLYQSITTKGNSYVSNPEQTPAELQLQLFAKWKGEIRMLIVHLIYGSNAEAGDISIRKWNWPIEDSVFYPGAEIAYVSGETLKEKCNFSSSELPYYKIGKRSLFLQDNPVSLNYNINVSKLYKCVSDMGGFSTPMPSQSNLIGAMWAAESSSFKDSYDTINSQGIWVSVEGMRLDY